MADDPHSVGDILDRLHGLADEQGTVSLGEAIGVFGDRSYAPFLIVLPLIEISPLGAVPGAPTVMALMIALTARQLMIGRRHLWLLGVLSNGAVKSGKIMAARYAPSATGWTDGSMDACRLSPRGPWCASRLRRSWCLRWPSRRSNWCRWPPPRRWPLSRP